MNNPLIYILALFILVGAGFYVGQVAHTLSDHEAIIETVLGEAECLKFKVGAPGPGGTIKIGEQLLLDFDELPVLQI